MAIWQYTFQIIPKESVEALSPELKLSNVRFDVETYWNYTPYTRDFFFEVDSVLLKKRSWSNEIDLYGNQELNCFEVFCDNKGHVLSVSFKIDFRENYESTLRFIIELCCRNGLYILDEDLKIVPWNYAQVRYVIESSPQVTRYHKLSKKDK